MIPFRDKLRKILREKHITVFQFCQDTGFDRASFFYRKKRGDHHGRHVYMAIAYYLGMDVDNLLDGTDAMDDFYDN